MKKEGGHTSVMVGDQLFVNESLEKALNNYFNYIYCSFSYPRVIFFP